MPSTTRSKTLNRRTTDKENHYTCNACGKSFTKKYKIAIHCQLHFGENPCRNKVYEEIMPSTTRSKILNRRTTDKENHYTCNACGKSFTKKYKIAIHCQLHFGENPCRNKVYEEIMPSTTRSKTLNRRTTDKENHYTCNACGKSFTKKYKIAIHCQLHFGENPCRNKALAGEVTKTKQKCFICDVCHATFKEKHHVARHCKIHTGDKPYKCTICGKFFRDQSNLMTHKCIHTVEKRFQCTQCGKKFMKNDNLLVHYRTHSHEKPYKCDVCKKSFSTSGNLSRHKLTEPKRLERVFGYFAF